MRWRPMIVLAIPAVAYAADYLSADQAQAALFPEADRFEKRDFPLGARVWKVRVAYKGAKVIGVAIIDDVVGKFDRITFAAGLGMDGVVRQVEILSYRESHGGEVRQESWRKQFAGKREDAPLRVGEDISNISGATLSCTHLADGVRASIAVLAALRHSGALQ